MSVRPSDLLRERVAQPVEHEVREQKERDRGHAKRQQPAPVAERTLEKQYFLIRNGEVRERVQVQEPLAEIGRVLPRVDDRRGKEPQLDHVRQDVSNVAEVDGQRRDEETEP